MAWGFMELVYIYIDKYRTFEKCGIPFSDRFSISYDHSKHVLSIAENKNYCNIYPNFISNINGILGRNASGKTSLLSLIGTKIEDRHNFHEIFARERNEPHKRIDIFSTQESSALDEIRYSSSYFLVYYLGTNADGVQRFIFETNTPQEYIELFVNAEDWIKEQEIGGTKLDYYVSHGWLSAVFSKIENKFKLEEDTQKYPGAHSNVQDDISIIYFQRKKYNNIFEIGDSCDEEPKICVKRRSVSVESLLLEPRIKFLSKQMKRGALKSHMFCDKKYTVVIQFANIMPSDIQFHVEDKKYETYNTVLDYRKLCIEELEEWQKIVLAFMNRYVWFLVTRIIHSYNGLNNENKLQIVDLQKMRTSSDSYECIKDMYREQIQYIYRKAGEYSPALCDFLKVESTLEEFLKNAKTYNIECVYVENELQIEISKRSDIGAAHQFFEDFVDESMHKNMRKCDSVLEGFLESDIRWLSDGERQNLAIFASIDEQVSLRSEKQKYILLFDEVERSMHPDLCRRFIASLIDFLGQYQGKKFQIILASHSPFIAGDLLSGNIVYLERKESNPEMSVVGTKKKEQPFAQNIHKILKSQFFLDAFMGEYAIRCIQLVLDCVNLPAGDDLGRKINQFLNDGGTESNDWKGVSEEEAWKFLYGIVLYIGENLIQQELLRRIRDKGQKSIMKEILYYEAMLKKLRGKMDD